MGLEMNAFRFGNAKYYYSKSFQQAFGNINPQKSLSQIKDVSQ